MIAKNDDSVKKKYKVYDFLENRDGDLLGVYHSKHDAQARVDQQYEDTDGECMCRIIEVKYEG